MSASPGPAATAEEREWEALAVQGVAVRDQVLAEWREEMARPWRPQERGDERMAGTMQDALQRRAAADGERAIALRADSIVLEDKLRSEAARGDHTARTADLMKDIADLVQKLREALP